METVKNLYLQFSKGREFPVFLKFTNEDFYLKACDVLEKKGFKKVDEKMINNLLKTKQKYHLLNVLEANAQVANIIRTGHKALEIYGNESVTPHNNYQVYKFHHYAMMVFSPFYNNWELGTVCDLTKDHDVKVFNVVIDRFLAIALVDYKVASFWGVPVDEGVVVMSQAKSKSEMIFFDLEKMKLMSNDGVKPISGDFQILRLDSSIKGESRKLKREELLSFLVTNNSYISYYGPSHIFKTYAYQLTQFCTGWIYPEENFVPRTDLPLAS